MPPSAEHNPPTCPVRPRDTTLCRRQGARAAGLRPLRGSCYCREKQTICVSLDAKTAKPEYFANQYKNTGDGNGSTRKTLVIMAGNVETLQGSFF